MTPTLLCNRIVVYHPESADKARLAGCGSVWFQRLQQKQLPVIDWDESKGDDQCDVNEVAFAVVWKPPKTLLKKFPNLKAIQSLGAGVDHLAGKDIPENIPVLRIVDPVMCQRMGTWMIWAVTNIHRNMDYFYQQQQHCCWNQSPGFEVRDNPEVTVGVMGLGAMGGETAKMLSHMQYKVVAWTRTPKNDEEQGFTCFSGRENLHQFASNCDILICLLPLTDETRGILCADLMYALPKGASIINAGRGKHLVEEDLISALDDGQINRAVLDVFQTEPLPKDSPLWSHPQVRITPHVSSLTPPQTGLAQIIQNYQRVVVQGQQPDTKFLVDMSRGY